MSPGVLNGEMSLEAKLTNIPERINICSVGAMAAQNDSGMLPATPFSFWLPFHKVHSHFY